MQRLLVYMQRKCFFFWKGLLEIRDFFLAHFLLNNVTSRNYDN